MTIASESGTSVAVTKLFASVDVNCWIGGYPFREVPHPDPDVLVKVLAREGIGSAWVGHLPGAFHRDPSASNRALYQALAPHAGILLPAPIIRPDWPGWRVELATAKNSGAAAVRAYPMQWGYGPGSPSLAELAYACGESGLILQLTVRFEDLRQRHHMDSAGDLSAAAIRALARLPGSRCHLMVLGAGRELIEEIHWGLTQAEQERVWFDFGWVWGPPDDHFAHLAQTMGGVRFVVGTAWPLRLTQQSRALVELLPPRVLKVFTLAEGTDIAQRAQQHAKID
ncbi:MAG: hypothetical protein H7Z40_18080 [Phycisphaerae bacterium]|nr:hypothetical protein [Gemmatimonadaceae bacterium]